ncbi:amino acid ABC transporter permease [Leekyejoonella antrihumi]|uniref:Amino acid ABC transporter permease n=2 Tax=Leekyejoonella antrihumi TaxID=1660198 RepID=A0A563DQ04_9MICO|nr:amino acid ABC transporter permease [Leekyejoonella antrihumi]
MRFIVIIARGIPYTLLLTVVSFAIGAALGLPLVALRRSRYAVIRALTALIIEIVRGVPVIVWLFVVYFGLGAGVIAFTPLEAAIIVLGVTSAAYMAEIYRSGMIGLPSGQYEAAAALGLNHMTTVRLVTGPQALRIALPSAVTYLLALFKNSSVAYTIGVTEMLFWAFKETEETLQGVLVYGIAGAYYLLMGLPLAVASRSLDRRLRARVATQ